MTKHLFNAFLQLTSPKICYKCYSYIVSTAYLSELENLNEMRFL